MFKKLYNTLTLKELRTGMKITAIAMMRRGITVQYPEEKTPISPRFRGLHALMSYNNGEERCIACKLCEAVCPASAITIESEERADKMRRTTRYDIDLFKCIFCGFCEEACPVDAIIETQHFEYAFTSRNDSILTKEKLLEIGRENNQKITAIKTMDSFYK